MAGLLTDIIFRSLVKAGFTTKGTDLTYLEEDTNKEIIIDLLAGVIVSAVGNISPYSAGTTYDVAAYAQYVSHAGNIYQFIGAGPFTGVTPGTNPAVWQLTTSGALIHAQNTDIALGGGGPYYVTAAQLKDIYYSNVVSITAADAINSITIGNPAYNTLRKGYLYYLIDKGIFLHALATNQLSRDGYLVAKNVDYQNASGNFIGAWRNGMSGVALNKLTAWNNVMYRNLTGVNGVSNPIIDTTNWIAVATTDPAYVTEYDKITYDLLTDKIYSRIDKRGNEIGCDSLQNWTLFTPVEVFQWGNDAVYDNVCKSGQIICSNNRGTINRVIAANLSQTTIENETGGSVYEIFISNCNGALSRNAGKTVRSCFFTSGTLITLDPAKDYDSLEITRTYSNLEIEIDITGLSTLDINSLAISLRLELINAGRIKFISGNATENLTAITNYSSYLNFNYRYFLQPATGLDLTIDATTDFVLKGGASNVVLKGTNFDWLEVKYLRTGANPPLFEINQAIY